MENINNDLKKVRKQSRHIKKWSLVALGISIAALVMAIAGVRL